MMNIPDKISTLYPPAIVNLPSGRYAIYSGYGNGGWFAVDENFTMEDALARWTKLQIGVEEKKPENDWKWSVANSKGTGSYSVEFDKRGWTCSCPGFGFRRQCRHISEIKQQVNI